MGFYLLRCIFPKFYLQIFLIFGLAACKQLPTTITSEVPNDISREDTKSSKISWENVFVRQDKLPKSVSENETVKDDNNSLKDIDLADKEIVPDEDGVETIKDDSNNIKDIDHIVNKVLPDEEDDETPNTSKKLDPADFIDKSAIDLTRAIGNPSMIRFEGAVQVWQYKLTTCVVDFYLYTDGGTMITKHSHMRSRILGDRINIATCTADVYEESQKIIVEE